MNILPYNLFTEVNDLNSGWIKIYQTLDEGINYTSDEDGGPLINIDFDKDSLEDVVKLKNPVNLRMAKFRKTGIKTWAGYKVERDYQKFTNKYRNEFLDYAKKLDYISNKDLKALINHTYPSKLKELGGRVKVLFVTGSGDSLSIRIAEALKELYHNSADIVDVLKAYYGVDIDDTINWDEYEKSGKTQKKQIDSYVNQYSNLDKKQKKLNKLEKELSKYLNNLSYDNRKNNGNTSPDKEYITKIEKKINTLKSQLQGFSGYIKKGGSIQTGRTRDKILKAGHSIDDYIISKVIDTQREWNKYKGPDMNIQKANQPHYILVDDVIIGGSTTKKIFELYIEAMENAISKNMYNKLNINLDYITLSTKGYVLFSYAKRHDITNKN